MSEQPLFLRHGGHELFAVHHEPEGLPNQRAFVFCHPLAEEKLWSHRVFVGMARLLAARGYHVLRFDLRGNGDSDGEFSQSSVASGLEDIRCAIADLKARTGFVTVDLLGLRFGATLASLVAEESEDIDRLVLWAPIVDGERFMQELLRMNVATQTAIYREVRHERPALVEKMRQGESVTVDGYQLAYALYDEASRINLRAVPKRHSGQTLIVQIDRQPSRVMADLQQLADSYPAATLMAVQEEPFWKEIAKSYLLSAPNLFTATLEWLGDAQTA